MVLADVIGSVRTIGEVVAAMRRIDGALADGDGLKWFNFLYLRVTEAVQSEGGWQDVEFLHRFDVRFAQLYFDAVVNWESSQSLTPHAWRPLLRSRADVSLSRLQFALAGMNAHINHDLAATLENLAAADGRFPDQGGPRHRDFRHVNNDILERVEASLHPVLAVGLLGDVDRKLGDLDSLLVMWNVRKAREAAWTNGEVLWQLRATPLLKREYLDRLDRMTSFAGHGLLVPRLGSAV
jgi:Family of unknown function (DUF5995)